MKSPPTVVTVTSLVVVGAGETAAGKTLSVSDVIMRKWNK